MNKPQKFTAPIREKTLARVRFIRGHFRKFVIADFVSEATDRAVKQACRRKNIVLPDDISFTPVSKS